MTCQEIGLTRELIDGLTAGATGYLFAAESFLDVPDSDSSVLRDGRAQVLLPAKHNLVYLIVVSEELALNF